MERTFEELMRTEEHYHIKDLIERQERRSSDRTYHQDQAKEKAEREDLITDSKIVAMTDFFCVRCKKDFKAQAMRQIEQDWSGNQRIAFYKTKCFQGHWCIRLITDKHKDSFWSKSRLIALDRGNHFNDTVQPSDIGFNTLYKKL